VPMADTALRWIRYHSRLRDAAGDAVLVGATCVEQLEANLRSWENGPLPDTIVKAFDAAWEVARPACQRYFRT